MGHRQPLHLFEAFGIELEYMIVDAESLDVRPVADRLLAEAERDGDLGCVEVERPEGSEVPSELAFESVDGERTSHPISWSNELTAHVIELKTSSPVSAITPALAADFQAHVRAIDQRLARHGARLLGTGSHPWMDPYREKVLWPHGFREFYEAFDRVFDCRGHGWANLQSMHINLPFNGDEEFGRLHAAIRLVLPILPGLAASSPVMDGKWMGVSDARLAVYKTNARKVPSVSGRVIPEPAFTRADYERDILRRIYEDIAPHDPDGLLQHEWLNARGAIARFDRNAIEIRVLDVQECPTADIGIAALVVGLLKDLCARPDQERRAQREWGVEPLAVMLDECIRSAEGARVSDTAYLRALLGDRLDAPASCTVGQLWGRILDRVGAGLEPAMREHVGRLLGRGSLASRLAVAFGPDVAPDRMLPKDQLRRAYGALAECLRSGEPFVPRAY